MALQETWIDSDDLRHIQADLAPTGYGVLDTSTDRRRRRAVAAVLALASRLIRGGGLPIVHHQELMQRQGSYQLKLATLTLKPATGGRVFYHPAPILSKFANLQN